MKKQLTKIHRPRLGVILSDNIKEKIRQGNISYWDRTTGTTKQQRDEARIVRTKQYLLDHRDKTRLYTVNYRARKRKATGIFTPKEWEALKRAYNYTCLNCKRIEPVIKLEPDHIIPLSRGGSNSIDNIQPLCRNCNAQKSFNIKDFRNEQ